MLKLEPLTNATNAVVVLVVDDTIRFVASNAAKITSDRIISVGSESSSTRVVQNTYI